MTLCIDVVSVLLAEINYASDYQFIENHLNSNRLIIVHRMVSKNRVSVKMQCDNNCLLPEIKEACVCCLKFYFVRPFAYQMLLAIQPYFEIIAISKLYFMELEQLLCTMEKELNKLVSQMNIQTFKQAEDLGKHVSTLKPSKTDKIKRFKPKLVELKNFFSMMICQKNFMYFEEIDLEIENFQILLSNRALSNILILNSSHMRLVAAMF